MFKIICSFLQTVDCCKVALMNERLSKWTEQVKLETCRRKLKPAFLLLPLTQNVAAMHITVLIVSPQTDLKVSLVYINEKRAINW